MKSGDPVRGYFPWLSGIRSGVILEKRVPLEGEYYYTRQRLGTIVQRKGTGYLSSTDARREFWIIQLLD